MKLGTTNNHKPHMHLGFHLLHCYAAKASSSRLSTCIHDWESRSPEPSSSVILHRERANKVFGKQSSRLLTYFFKFCIMSHLPLCRTCIEGHRLQHELHQTDCRLYQKTASHVRFFLSNHVLHIEYVDLCRHDFAR
jgi:hypothetical protein